MKAQDMNQLGHSIVARATGSIDTKKIIEVENLKEEFVKMTMKSRKPVKSPAQKSKTGK
jgi:hypothetical protein